MRSNNPSAPPIRCVCPLVLSAISRIFSGGKMASDLSTASTSRRLPVAGSLTHFFSLFGSLCWGFEGPSGNNWSILAKAYFLTLLSLIQKCLLFSLSYFSRFEVQSFPICSTHGILCIFAKIYHWKWWNVLKCRRHMEIQITMFTPPWCFENAVEITFDCQTGSNRMEAQWKVRLATGWVDQCHKPTM